jgi:hypothetical protein
MRVQPAPRCVCVCVCVLLIHIHNFTSAQFMLHTACHSRSNMTLQRNSSATVVAECDFNTPLTTLWCKQYPSVLVWESLLIKHARFSPNWKPAGLKKWTPTTRFPNWWHSYIIYDACVCKSEWMIVSNKRERMWMEPMKIFTKQQKWTSGEVPD